MHCNVQCTELQLAEIGPQRTCADTLCRQLAPEFELVEDASEIRRGFPFFMGRAALIGRIGSGVPEQTPVHLIKP